MSYHQSIEMDKDTVVTVRKHPAHGQKSIGLHLAQPNRPGAGDDGVIWFADAESLRRLAKIMVAEAEGLEHGL